jgi:uncharacterized membrane-anchored protein
VSWHEAVKGQGLVKTSDVRSALQALAGSAIALDQLLAREPGPELKSVVDEVSRMRTELAVVSSACSVLVLQRMVDAMGESPERASCQACRVHAEHDRCTGENTLGTDRCACALRGHPGRTG